MCAKSQASKTHTLTRHTRSFFLLFFLHFSIDISNRPLIRFFFVFRRSYCCCCCRCVFRYSFCCCFWSIWLNYFCLQNRIEQWAKAIQANFKLKIVVLCLQIITTHASITISVVHTAICRGKSNRKKHDVTKKLYSNTNKNICLTFKFCIKADQTVAS